jgi:DNA-binding MarR family transcriptional regulator
MSNPDYVVEAQHLIRTRPGFAAEIARQINGRPMGGGLTRRQMELLAYIRGYVGKHGYAPSFEEMKQAIGLASKSGIHRMIKALEERGYVTSLYNKARSIELRRVA